MAVVAGVLGILCAGGIGVAVLLYDEETKIERTAPDAVVDNFLGAYLLNRDDKVAELYMCEKPSLNEIATFRTDIVTREQSFSVGITVSWGSFQVATNGNQKTVTTDLTKSTANGNERVTKPWQFDVVDQDGWRVCGARQIVG